MPRVWIALAGVIAALAAPTATAAPQFDKAFDMPNVETNDQLVQGPDGNIWVALGGAVARVKPDGTVNEYLQADFSSVLGFPAGGIASAGGYLWVSQQPSVGTLDPIVRIQPGDPPTFTGVAVSDITSGATAMTKGPDGDVWVAFNDTIVKFPTSDPTASTKYTVTGMVPKAIARASDGTLWITDSGNGEGKLLHVTTAGAVTPVTVGGNPQFVHGGPNGQVVYGNPNTTPQTIGLLTATATTPITLDRPNGSDPFGVTFGDDGAYWVAEFAGNRLARVTPDGQLTTLTGFPTLSGQPIGPRQITKGPGHTLWATLDTPGAPTKSKIARITGVELPPAPPPPGGGTPPPDTTAPALAAVKLSRATFRRGAKTLVLTFSISEAGSAKVTLVRRLPGRRRGAACVKPTHRLRRAGRCTRVTTLRAIPLTAVAGANTTRISLRGLRRGRYSLTLNAADAAGNQSPPVTRRFRIL